LWILGGNGSMEVEVSPKLLQRDKSITVYCYTLCLYKQSSDLTQSAAFEVYNLHCESMST